MCGGCSGCPGHRRPSRRTHGAFVSHDVALTYGPPKQHWSPSMTSARGSARSRTMAGVFQMRLLA
eukprot:3091678-Heterocapsa_arctica.AAC.1